MNKKQLITRVQRYMGPGATRKTASAAVEAVLSSIRKESRKHVVHIAHFGVFTEETRAERTGAHPVNGETIIIPQHKRLIFRPSGKLTRRILPD